jgi:ribonuclease R
VPSTQIDIDHLLSVLAESEGGASADDLASELGLDSPGRKALLSLLGRIQGTGLVRRKGNELHWAQSPRVFVGTLRQRGRKLISFVPNDLRERSSGRIRIELEDCGGAFDGDRVIATIAPQVPDALRSARVEMILRRGQLRIVGRLHHGFRQSWVESLDEKFSHEIDIATPEAKEFEDGWIVVVEVSRYPAERENAAGRIVSALGASSDEPGIDIEVVIAKHSLPSAFPPEVDEETLRVGIDVGDEQRAGRLDLRHVPTVTIDGETARDFDDAISLARLANGNYHLSVHIADVAHYVTRSSQLDNEARLRGTSVYFPERAIPMLPERLSNGICSLNPKVDRLTMSALMEVDREGSVVSHEFRETVIRSDERMTYTAVNAILEKTDPELLVRYASLIDLFNLMRDLAKILIAMRERRGAIDFNLPESVFEFDDEGRIGGVVKAERNMAHRLIEEFMLLANETVAAHLASKGPSIFRIHEEPKPQRVMEFAELAAAYGYKFPATGAGAMDYQRLSKAIEGKPEERVLAFSMLRSLERARYSARNLGHFGLAAPIYTHFTSPIRRYPDLIVHRLLKSVLGNRDRGAKLSLPELEEIAEESSDRERVAVAAERELEEWRKAVFMADRVGEEFDALIVNVREFGFFVELEDLFVEGLVPVSTLSDDYYVFDERRHALSGRKGRRTFKLGDRLRVRLNRVNVDRHLLDFAVVAEKRREEEEKPRNTRKEDGKTRKKK